MKFSIDICVTLLLIIGTIDNCYGYYTEGHNGRPQCLTTEEMVQRTWRNNFDPTRYWVCSEQGVAGTEELCEYSKLFDATKNECVNAADWVWTEPVDPPSLAKSY